MVIPRELPGELGEAVSGFRDVMDYICTESLNKKTRKRSNGGAGVAAVVRGADSGLNAGMPGI